MKANIKMSFDASSYFGGVATVLVTVVLGFGGGVLMTDALVGNSDQPKAGRLEQRVAETATPAKAVVASEPAPAENPPATPPTTEAARVEPAQPAPTPSMAPPVVVQENPNLQPAIAQSQAAEVKKAWLAGKRKEQRRKWAERRKQEIEVLNAAAENANQARNREPVVRTYAAQSQPFSVFRLD